MGTSKKLRKLPNQPRKRPSVGAVGPAADAVGGEKRFNNRSEDSLDILRSSALLICLSVTTSACELNAPMRDSRKDSFSWASSGSDRSVEVTVTKTGGGVASGKIQANSPFTQVLSVDGATSVSGTVLSFPPGTLMVPTEVRVEEGASVAIPSTQAAVGLVGNVTQAGTPVAVTSSVTTDPVVPFSIALSIPDSAALLETSMSFAVVYKIVRHKDGSFITGVIPTSAISVIDRKARFEASYFGVYQVVLTKSPVTEAKSVAVTAPILTKAEVANLAPMQVSGRSSLVVTAGQTVELRGKNFRPTMQLALGDTMIRGINVASDVSASFVAPALSSFGLKDLSIDQDGVSQTVSLVYQGGASDFPVITLPPTEVCVGQKFYDARGQLQSGTKACFSVPPPAACAQDGAVGCVTTADYPAVAASGLSAKVLAGATVAGVVGTVLPELHGPCAVDGATGCVANNDYKAAKMANFTAGDIATGIAVAGVVGTASPAPSDCAANGSWDCVARGAFRAATTCAGGGSNCFVPTYQAGSQPLKAISYDSIQANQGSMRTSLNIAGVAGTLGDCAVDGGVDCVANGSFPAVAQASLMAENIKNGVNIGGVIGIYPSAGAPLANDTMAADLTSFGSGTPIGAYEFFDSAGNVYSAAVADQTIQPGVTNQNISGPSILYRQVTVNGDSSLSASNIRNGPTIFGIVGSMQESPSLCSANNVIGCVTTSSFRSADWTNLTSANIKNNVTVAGVAGSYPSAGNHLAGSTPTLDLTSAGPSTASGAYEYFDSQGGRYTLNISSSSVTPSPSAQTVGINGTLYSSVSIAGTAGLVTSTCVADGAQGCIASGQYYAAQACDASIPKIDNCYVPTYVQNTKPLKATSYDAIVNGASAMRSTLTLAGVAGTMSDCVTDGGTGCIATASFKAVDMSKLISSNIKSGVAIADVTGAYPSANHRLASDTATADLMSFGSGMTPGTYEFFDSTGARYSANITDTTAFPEVSDRAYSNPSALYRQVTVRGDPNLSGANIKSGVSVFNVSGTLVPKPGDCAADGATGCVAVTSYKAVQTSKLTAGVIKSGQNIGGVTGTFGPSCTADGAQNCLVASGSTFKAANISGISSWDIRAGKTLAGMGGSLVFYRNMVNNSVFNRTTGTGASSFADKFDTIDDYNYYGAADLPVGNPWDGLVPAPSVNWEVVSGACDGPSGCILKEKNSGMMWARSDGIKKSWEEAITHCNGLSNGLSGWRLPTQKELLQAYVNGLWSKKSALNLTTVDEYWSSTTLSNATSFAWVVGLYSGGTKEQWKNGDEFVLCTR